MERESHILNERSNFERTTRNSEKSVAQGGGNNTNNVQIPTISLVTGGGVIKCIEEKFQVNVVTEISSLSVAIYLSPSRQGFVPSVGLSYNSGPGKSSFGLDWNVGISAITRKNEKKFPEYNEPQEPDAFILSGAEDLVPRLEKNSSRWKKFRKFRKKDSIAYTPTRYRPILEGAFSRIEKWKTRDNVDTPWHIVSLDNTHSYYGLTPKNRISEFQYNWEIFDDQN